MTKFNFTILAIFLTFTTHVSAQTREKTPEEMLNARKNFIEFEKRTYHNALHSDAYEKIEWPSILAPSNIESFTPKKVMITNGYLDYFVESAKPSSCHALVSIAGYNQDCNPANTDFPLSFELYTQLYVDISKLPKESNQYLSRIGNMHYKKSDNYKVVVWGTLYKRKHDKRLGYGASESPYWIQLDGAYEVNPNLTQYSWRLDYVRLERRYKEDCEQHHDKITCGYYHMYQKLRLNDE